MIHPNPVSSDDPTSKLSNYRLGEVIGRGSFTKVRRGLELNSGREVAVKVVKKRVLAESGLMNEIAIWRNLKHPNVVNLLDHFETPDKIYLICEYLTGGEMFERITQGQGGHLSEPVARHFFRQILNGVSYLHSQGVAHRDLKPENFLLSGGEIEMVKINDFGLSTIASEVLEEGSGSGSSRRRLGPVRLLRTTCGTPNYIAPEVLKEEGYDGYKADVWSLGVVLYSMLAGQLPFADESMAGLFHQIQKGTYLPLPETVSIDAREIIDRVLVVTPGDRLELEELLSSKWLNVE